MKASFQPYTLNFKRPSGTSRGVLRQKETYFLTLEKEGIKGVGECNMFRGLSYDDVPNYESVLQKFCDRINAGEVVRWEDYRNYPSIQFGYEQALIQVERKQDVLFPSEFTEGKEGIVINGLIWMGDISFMKRQLEEKIKQGFHCIKLKIGPNWQEEKRMLKALRSDFPADVLELRVDANGAFTLEEAKIVLEELSELRVHSIEQPIKAGNWDDMMTLCENTPTPIALDEELIGVIDLTEKINLIRNIQPQYIILKPALVGGFQGSEEWIELANQHNIGWWITSALESNIGLNAIAQWTYTLGTHMPQGLGTGSLFTNNIPSPLEVRGEKLWYNPMS